MKIKSLGYLWIESTDVGKWRDYGTGILGLQLAPGMPGASCSPRMPVPKSRHFATSVDSIPR